MDKPRVLLVDDNEIIRIYFREIFWIHGLEQEYDLTLVDSLDKAEALIKDPKTRPQIVFCDLVLPHHTPDGRDMIGPEGGFSLIQKIKGDPELQNIRIIVFSGQKEKAYKDKAKRLGAEGYMIKSDNMPEDIVAFMRQLSARPALR